MFDTITGFGDQLFTSIFLIVALIITSHIFFGFDTKKSKEAFIILFLLLLVAVQYYHLLKVSTFIPASRFFTYDNSLKRIDCMRSDKGGKRPKGSRKDYDFNPCYCNSTIANCYTKLDNIKVNGTCPTDGSALCRDFNNTRIPLFVSPRRNCKGGQGPLCTKNEPCYPCELTKIIEFNSDRCRTCSTDFKGDCNFIPEIGPYCYDQPNSKKVVPCKKCCTEATPKIVNGTCY